MIERRRDDLISICNTNIYLNRSQPHLEVEGAVYPTVNETGPNQWLNKAVFLHFLLRGRASQ